MAAVIRLCILVQAETPVSLFQTRINTIASTRHTPSLPTAAFSSTKSWTLPPDADTL